MSDAIPKQEIEQNHKEWLIRVMSERQLRKVLEKYRTVRGKDMTFAEWEVLKADDESLRQTYIGRVQDELYNTKQTRIEFSDMNQGIKNTHPEGTKIRKMAGCVEELIKAYENAMVAAMTLNGWMFTSDKFKRAFIDDTMKMESKLDLEKRVLNQLTQDIAKTTVAIEEHGAQQSELRNAMSSERLRLREKAEEDKLMWLDEKERKEILDMRKYWNKVNEYYEETKTWPSTTKSYLVSGLGKTRAPHVLKPMRIKGFFLSEETDGSNLVICGKYPVPYKHEATPPKGVTMGVDNKDDVSRGISDSEVGESGENGQSVGNTHNDGNNQKVSNDPFKGNYLKQGKYSKISSNQDVSNDATTE